MRTAAPTALPMAMAEVSDLLGMMEVAAEAAPAVAEAVCEAFLEEKEEEEDGEEPLFTV
jgi:hypothetical protein